MYKKEKIIKVDLTTFKVPLLVGYPVKDTRKYRFFVRFTF